jgi:hypothetical protein
MCTLELKQGDSTILATHFTIENKDGEKMLPSLYMEFTASFDFELIENDHDNTNVASATEHFELQANEKVDCAASFTALGNPRKGFCLRGALYYDVEVNSRK